MQNSILHPREVKWNPSETNDRLADPLRWRKPRRIFVCSMSDLFHEAVPFEFIHSIWDTMKRTPRHQYLVLTKRPDRMCEIVERIYRMEALGHAQGFWSHVWLGTSVEDRAALDRIVHLRKCPAAVRFISFEPLLQDLGDIECHLRLLGYQSQAWAIVGGESGPKARPCHIEWLLHVVEQCAAARVPCFVKQLGSWSGTDKAIDIKFKTHDPKGGDPSEWPEDLRVRQWPREESNRG